jgi:hypothetical protein
MSHPDMLTRCPNCGAATWDGAHHCARPMSIPRLFLIVAIGGILGAVLVWGALALVYGPEAALVLRVLFSAAVAGVVHWRVKATGETSHGDPVEHADEAAAAGNRLWPDIHHWVEPDPAPAGVVRFRGFDRNGAAVEFNAPAPAPAPEPEPVADDYGPAVREVVCGMLAGDPFAGAVYPSGGHGKRGKRRPGQWGWRARMLRARRLQKAWVARTTARDERQCQRAGRINRAARRAAERASLEEARRS